MARIYGFEPVCAPDAQVLILGSMPSVQSLAQGFYYAHPRNAFWQILSEIFGETLQENVDARKEFLLRHHLALWDSIGSCEREGSLDSDIRMAMVNDFGALFDMCPQIRRICFNGRTAHQQFASHAVQHLSGRQALLLPSTSPAYTMKYEQKREIWRQAILYGKGAEV